MNESTKGVAEQSVRWPYVVAAVSAGVASIGLVYAPISGIVYVLGLPGLLVAAVWALAHRSAAGRQPLVLAAALMALGLVMGIAAVLIGRQLDMIEALRNVWFDGMLMGAMLLFPLTSIVLAIIGASYGLGSRAASRRRVTHVVDLQP